MTAMQISGRRFKWSRGNPALWVSGIVLAVVFASVVFAGLIAPAGPLHVDILNASRGPSTAHLLGTDDSGRDILSRLIVGARASIVGPALVIVVATVLALLLAVAAAWRGGAVDVVVSRLFDLVFAFPSLVLAVVAVAMFGTGLMAPVVALAIAYTPYIGRVVRSTAVRERAQTYIAALETQGFSAWWICVRHLVPNLLPLVLVQASLNFGSALLDLAAVSYLGLGVQPPAPEWGLMVADGQSDVLTGRPEQALFAATAIVLTVVSVNVFGNRLASRMGVTK